MILQMTQVVQGGLRQERKLEMITNHLANVSTTGFKADVLSFDALFRAKMTIDFSQGDLRKTGNHLDLALDGDGFFKVQTHRGIRYTRNGTFTLDKDYQLVTQDGDPVLGEAGPITINGTEIRINETGEIHVDNQLVGKLDVVSFVSKDKLVKEGGSLFVNKDPQPEEIAATSARVIQGALEMPNVSTIVEMTRMIETLRSYESYQKMLQAYDETDSKLINEIGKT
ncbi:MAG: flagellar hook-basal body protein [Deltaproteobacteria bacterium]|nr:flagellar hook-basal body protein [Deltaproteobacteria bacterium]